MSLKGSLRHCASSEGLVGALQGVVFMTETAPELAGRSLIRNVKGPVREGALRWGNCRRNAEVFNVSTLDVEMDENL